MKLWLAKDKCPILGSHTVCLFVGHKPALQGSGIWNGREKSTGRWVVDARLGATLKPGEVKRVYLSANGPSLVERAQYTGPLLDQKRKKAKWPKEALKI